jgi:DNA-binding NarL/FixJ family response regulator
MAAQLARTRPALALHKKSIFLVDDHPLLRRGLVELIQAQPDLTICGEASTFGETYAFVENVTPDLVVSDISLDGDNGLDLMKKLKDRWPDLKILAFSMNDEAIYADRALRAGAMGYVAKQSPAQVLLDGIRAVLGGKVYLSEKMSEKLLGKIVRGGGSAKSFRSPLETLSDREVEVFQLLGAGSTTAEIADRLRLSIKTIETYREHIKRKLALKCCSELIRHAVEFSHR